MYMFVLVNINYMFILMFVATCICFYHKLSLPFSIQREMSEMLRRYVRGDFDKVVIFDVRDQL